MRTISANVIHTPSWDYIENGNGDVNYYLFNGQPPEKTFESGWLRIPKNAVITRPFGAQKTNYRFELIDESLSDRLPVVVECPTDVKEFTDRVGFNQDVYAWQLIGKMEPYQSLYRLAYDEVVPEPEPTQLIEVNAVDLPDIRPPVDFSYPVKSETYYGSTYQRLIQRDDTKNQLIDRLFFPSLVKHELPSVISSQDMYALVREHVKTHIDGKYAEVHSDYDFCFSVDKRIILKAPKQNKYEIHNARGGHYRPPKYRYETQVHRTVQVFEMTNAKDKYQSYTVIQGMTGDNLEDLKAKIDAYLDNLMTIVNEPVHDCPTCAGLGVITIPVAKTNPE